MNPAIVQIILDALNIVSGLQTDSEEIIELKQRLAEYEQELADAIAEWRGIERPDTERSDDELERDLGSITGA